MATEKVACRCGFLTRAGPFCEACGSPLNVRREAAEAAAFRPARKPPSAPLPTIPIASGPTQGQAETPSNADGILCTWCGAMSPPGPGCETCGSPIGTGALFGEEDASRPPGAEPGRLRLVTPPPEEESDRGERRDVGT